MTIRIGAGVAVAYLGFQHFTLAYSAYLVLAAIVVLWYLQKPKKQVSN